jgi:hypothetical protein
MRDYARYTDDELQSALLIVSAGLDQANRTGPDELVEDYIERKEIILAEMGLRCAKAYRNHQRNRRRFS